MTELQTVLNEFDNPQLNKIGAEMIDNYKAASKNLRIAQENVNMAIIRRWKNGKLLVENYEEIIEECGTQREYSERIGVTEAMLSNDKRSYEALLEEGVEEEDQLIFHLQQKEISPTTYSWERLPKLLKQPESSRQKDNRPKDEKRLEELYEELQEIRERNVNNSEIINEADYIQTEIKEIEYQQLSEDPLNIEWESEAYTEFIRHYGRDSLTGEPIPPGEVAHPHHINYRTLQAGGGVGNKLPDVFQIPVSADTHREIHNGNFHPTKSEVGEALITVMANFIIHYAKQ